MSKPPGTSLPIANRNAHKPRLIYISSSSVFYRDGHQFNLTEASPIGPRLCQHLRGHQICRGMPGTGL